MRREFAFLLMVSLFVGEGSAAPSRRRAAAPTTTSAAAANLIQSCDAHKFETLVTALVDGQPEQKKIRLCGVEGQSDADWIKTLNDAIRKLQADPQMAAGVRDQIVSAIRSEIARLSLASTLSSPRVGNPDIAATSALPLSNDYSALPPLPQPRAAPSDTGSEDLTKSLVPRSLPAEPVQKDYSELPPIPPPPTARLVSSSTLAPIRAPLAVPRITFGCDAPNGLTTDTPCADFERETTLIIHAAEDIPGGTVLQFVRNNEPRADVPLAGLKRGASLRLALPPKVCSGFASGKLELRIVHGEGEGTAEPLASEGPYSLVC